jgi:SRSO17 transposase
VGVVAARGQGPDRSFVHPGAAGSVGRSVPRWAARAGAAQDRLAAAAGDPGPWRQQAILGRGRWEALRDIVRDYALADAVLVLDETGFLKQGCPQIL